MRWTWTTGHWVKSKRNETFSSGILSPNHGSPSRPRTINRSFEVVFCFVAAFVVSLIQLMDYFYEKLKFHPYHRRSGKRL